MALHDSAANEGTDRFDYFMVRVSRTAKEPGLAGLVERLGTGEKRGFGSGEQLLSLMGDCPEADPKLEASTNGSNAAESSVSKLPRSQRYTVEEET
jgi:hypothetical protein